MVRMFGMNFDSLSTQSEGYQMCVLEQLWGSCVCVCVCVRMWVRVSERVYVSML